MKARWGTNSDRSELTEYWLKLFIRSDYSGNALVHHESGFPLYSYAPELKQEDIQCLVVFRFGIFLLDMVNGFRQHFNVVEIIHYHVNGL
jgi:hypothetical protein